MAGAEVRPPLADRAAVLETRFEATKGRTTEGTGGLQWAALRHQHFVEWVSKKEPAGRFGLDIQTVRRAPRREQPAQRAPVVRAHLPDPHREEITALLKQDPKITAKRIGRILEPRAGRIKPGDPMRTIRHRRIRLPRRRDEAALRSEARTDGIFPLVTNQEGTSKREVLEIHKFRPTSRSASRSPSRSSPSRRSSSRSHGAWLA